MNNISGENPTLKFQVLESGRLGPDGFEIKEKKKKENEGKGKENQNREQEEKKQEERKKKQEINCHSQEKGTS